MRPARPRCPIVPAAALLVAAVAVHLSAVSPARAAEPLRLSHRDRLYDVAVDGQFVLVVGYPGMLLRSEDGGRSFARVNVPTGEALFAVAVGASGFAVAAGRGGVLLVSTDRGRTWAARRDPALGSEPLFDVSVTARGRLVAVGELATIVISDDRGQSFRKAAIRFELDRGPEDAEGDGAEAGFEDEGETVIEEARLTSVAFASDALGYAVGEFGIVLVTRDGGESWARVQSGTEQLLFGVAALNATRALAVGAEGTLLESQDTGNSWVALASPVSESLFGVASIDGHTLVVGADGTVLVRADSGSFQRSATAIHTWLAAPCWLEGRHALVVGGRGHVLRSDDGAQSFRRLLGD